jgi:hypothetical protein
MSHSVQLLKRREAVLTIIPFWSGFLDYYDSWNEIDPRLSGHYPYLSRASDIFAHDLVNMATYTNEIIGWLDPDRIRLAPSVVCVAGMAEAFFVSTRSAYDAVAISLSYVACEKRGQAPADSLRSLLDWAKKNGHRMRPQILAILNSDVGSFKKVRSVRDHMVHGGAHANIHSTGRQFNLWLHSPKIGWVTREPLLPLLSKQFRDLITFADSAAEAINKIIDLPQDRIRSRVVNGILIPALHKLEMLAPQYADPSP